MSTPDLWRRYREQLCVCDGIGLRIDPSRMEVPDGFFERMAGPMERAYDAMEALEGGAVANPDEGRRVGHYWLRAPELAPEPELRRSIEDAVDAVEDFTARVHGGDLKPQGAPAFTDLLVIGIGGSALGPQLVADALGRPGSDRLRPSFFDNTDPDGMAKVLEGLGDRLPSTLAVVISKSGGTAETRNGMLVARAAFEARGLDFARHAVAITGEGSKLDRIAEADGWLARFPMWDWVGGRTSETSAVGLLPAALQGLDVRGLLAGARACDEVTRRRDTPANGIPTNPAALLALLWFHATGGRGERDMVMLPYKDRLLLLSRYLQQLVMESLGKDRDLDGNPVAQGLAVYGNKGSTDQHAYVQQLREGVDNFFVTFVSVVEDGGADLEVEPGVRAGDYLRGFLLGTREALREAGRPSITVTVDRVDAFHLGVLIALFERAVGFYAGLIHVNAYHQPGVEAGKKAAAEVLAVQGRLLAHLSTTQDAEGLDAIAAGMERGEGDDVDIETVFHLLEALSGNGRVERLPGDGPFTARYRLPAA
ncbi:MAG: glucose-6-phosphate isomerase [Acidobacteriota bacterium]